MKLELSNDQRAWLEERAPLEGLDAGAFLRLVVEHAMVHMEPGWRPDTDFTLCYQRARAEADSVARRLTKIEAECPGYVDRLASLPQEQQTEKIYREVYPDADTAWLPPWATAPRSRYVVVSVKGSSIDAVAKVPARHH